MVKIGQQQQYRINKNGEVIPNVYVRSSGAPIQLQGSDLQRDYPAFECVQIGQKTQSYSDSKDKKNEEKWEIQNMMSPSSDRAVPDSFDYFLDNF